MKHCPKCNEVYSDGNLSFCLNDGTVLSDEFGNAETLLMSSNTVPNRLPSTLPPSTSFNSGITSPLTYASIGLLSLVIGGIVLWLTVGDKFLVASPTTPLVETNISPPANESKKNEDSSSTWTFLNEAANGDFKISYLKQDRTLKFKFTNDGVATAKIKYRIRIEYKTKGEWLPTPWYDSTVTVKTKQEQLDNFPLMPVVEDIRKVEFEITDWNYIF